MKYFSKKNSPTLAYETVYGKKNTPFLMGRTTAPKKMWNGMTVDASLEDRWLNDLNALPVEIKSTEEGKGPSRPAFVVFRMPEGEDSKADKMVLNLKRNGFRFVTKDIGMQGRPRICVAEPVKVGDRGWKLWWDTLAHKILKSYNALNT